MPMSGTLQVPAESQGPEFRIPLNNYMALANDPQARTKANLCNVK